MILPTHHELYQPNPMLYTNKALTLYMIVMPCDEIFPLPLLNTIRNSDPRSEACSTSILQRIGRTSHSE